MKPVLLILNLFLYYLSFAQTSNGPVDVTPELQKKIKQDIEKEIPQLKKKLESQKTNPVFIEFKLDTFRVERLMEKWIDLDYRDYSMNEAGYEAARLYDSLLNKYYKKLLAVLKEDDKKILIQAQKAWLTFRDNEMKLTGVISKDEYSGGGTMQRLTESSKYLELITRRTTEIFNHYTRATQTE